MSTLEYLYEKIKNILIKFTSWRNFETKAIFIARGTARTVRIQCGTRAARDKTLRKCASIPRTPRRQRRFERAKKPRRAAGSVAGGAKTLGM